MNWLSTLTGAGVGWLLGSIVGHPNIGAALGAVGGYVYGAQPAAAAAAPTTAPALTAPVATTPPGPSTDPLSSANVAAGTSSYDAGGGGGSF